MGLTAAMVQTQVVKARQLEEQATELVQQLAQKESTAAEIQAATQVRGLVAMLGPDFAAVRQFAAADSAYALIALL